MKLAQYVTAGPAGRQRHLGALVEGGADQGTLLDLTAGARRLLRSDGLGPDAAERLVTALLPPRLLTMVQNGARARALADEVVEAAAREGWDRDPDGAPIRHGTDEVVWLPVITDPPLLRDFMAFEDHLLNVFPKLGREIPDEWYRRPVYYKANPAALGAHRQDIVVPPEAERLDLEFELALIIGRDGVDIAEEQAADHIFGYTVYDDFSARDVQAKEMTVGLGPAKGKDFLGGHVLGPVVVTADELGDPYRLQMTGTVNGETWTHGSSADMHWSFAQMISYASRGEQIRAGEVFGSGTVGGGSGAEQDRVLDPGDVVALSVDGIGTLRNTVVAGTPPA